MASTAPTGNAGSPVVEQPARMGKFAILRLDYLFAVIIPCLMALYINELALVDHLDTILGWAFLGIAGNVINDIIDDDRKTGWRRKELAAIALGSLALAALCFSRVVIENALNLLWIVTAVGLVLGYCLGIKKVPVLSSLVQVLGELLFPFFTISFPPAGTDWWWIAGLYSFGVLSQVVHESIDGEAITRFSKGAVRAIIIALSVLTILIGVVVFMATLDFRIIPFATVPIATIYMYRHHKHPVANIKNVGLVLGNFFMVYFFILVLML